jgi:hypothetical protein
MSKAKIIAKEGENYTFSAQVIETKEMSFTKEQIEGRLQKARNKAAKALAVYEQAKDNCETLEEMYKEVLAYGQV